MTDRAQALAPTPMGYSYKLVMLGLERDDLSAAAAYLKTVPPEMLLEDAFASRAAQVYLRMGDGEKALHVLRRIPRDVLEENVQILPKGYLAGWALRIGGKQAAAQAEWRQALAAMEKRLAAEPNRPLWLRWKALLLALTDRREDARQAQKLYLELRGSEPVWTTADFLVAVGETEDAIRVLEKLPQERRWTAVDQFIYGLRHNPWFAPIRDDPRVQKIIADSIRARPVAATSGPDVSSAAEKSVAVLAFENRSSETDSEYFSDGVGDELINVLGRVPGLRVVGRTSSYSFKGKPAPSREIGRALNVAHLAWKTWALTDLGRKDEALKLARRVELTPDERDDNIAFASAYALREAGETGEAEAFARKLTGYRRFIATAGSGHPAEALPFLDPPLFSNLLIHYLLFLPALDPVRSDPRFASALETLGLTEAHARAQAWRAANPPAKAPTAK